MNALKLCKVSRTPKKLLKISAFYLDKQKSFILKKELEVYHRYVFFQPPDLYSSSIWLCVFDSQKNIPSLF